jgi:hypothetical protein
MLIEIFDNLKELPKTKEQITVVLPCDDDKTAIWIQNYQHGVPVNDGLYYSCTDLDNSILTYDYKDRVFIESGTEGKFTILREQAELFKSCGNDLERYDNALKQRLEERLEFNLYEFDDIS